MRGAQQIFSGAHSATARERGSTDDWGTPQAFYDMLHEEFSFTLDPCASPENAKAEFFTVDDDGLEQDWGENICFVNFPYSQAKAWAAKCVDAALNGATVVVLCAARTDAAWWQYLVAGADEVRFVKGRLAFVGLSNTGQSATFPSSVIVLLPRLKRRLKFDRLVLWDVPSEIRR